MRKLTALTPFVLLAAIASAQGTKPTLFVGDPAPPMVIAKWAKGTPVEKLGNGKITVVEFWATWCGPCKQSIPHLTELAKKYSGKATFVGVDSFEHVADDATCFSKVSKFVEDFGDKMNYNVAIDGNAGTMGKTWMMASGQNGIPTAFVVDKAGKIAWIGHPMMGLDEVVGKVIDGTFDSKAEADKQKAQALASQAESEKRMKLLAPLTKALGAKDFKAAVEAANTIMAAEPMYKTSMSISEIGWMSQYDAAAAMKQAQSLADNEFKSDASGLNSIAWFIVEDKSPVKNADFGVAVKIAEKAAKVSNDDPMILDTLALCYYRAKRTADAVATENKAIQKASGDKSFDAATLAEFKTRLASFNSTTSSQN
ncbi:MAG: redoxin family protein [Fimbriimonas sp.]|nr:redoxin family protein [Fimbriimonas sp.]